MAVWWWSNHVGLGGLYILLSTHLLHLTLRRCRHEYLFAFVFLNGKDVTFFVLFILFFRDELESFWNVDIVRLLFELLVFEEQVVCMVTFLCHLSEAVVFFFQEEQLLCHHRLLVMTCSSHVEDVFEVIHLSSQLFDEFVILCIVALLLAHILTLPSCVSELHRRDGLIDALCHRTDCGDQYG